METTAPSVALDVKPEPAKRTTEVRVYGGSGGGCCCCGCIFVLLCILGVIVYAFARTF